MLLLSEAMISSNNSNSNSQLSATSDYVSTVSLFVMEKLLYMSQSQQHKRDTCWWGLDDDESMIVVERLIDVALLDIWSNDNISGGTEATLAACRILCLESVYRNLLDPCCIVLLHRLLRGILLFVEKNQSQNGQKLRFYWACMGILSQLLVSGWVQGNDIQKKAIKGVLDRYPKERDCDCSSLTDTLEIPVPRNMAYLGEITYLMHDAVFDYHSFGCMVAARSTYLNMIQDLVSITFGI
jgi:hypothetical protein